MKKTTVRLLIIMVALIAASCSQLGTGGSIPTQGNINDSASASRYLPNLPGYISTDVQSISDAISAAGGSAALFSGNPVAAALIAQIDGMIDCYKNVGALAAKAYVQADIASVMDGNVPMFGAMAVINQDRIINNAIPCALGAGVQRSQADSPRPCASSGSFTVDGETLYYLYAASSQTLCSMFQSAIPSS